MEDKFLQFTGDGVTEAVNKVVTVYVAKKANAPQLEWRPALNGQVGVFQQFSENAATSYSLETTLDSLVEKGILVKGTVRIFLLDCDEAGFQWVPDTESYDLPDRY